MSITRQLYHLQEIDLDIEAREQSLSQNERRLGDRSEPDAARAALNARQKALEDLKHRLRSAEWEVDDISGKIADAEDKLYGGKITNPKELSSLQHEVGTFKEHRDELEGNTLELMDKVEAAEKDLATATGNLEKLEETWQQDQQSIAEDIKKLQSELEALSRQRRQAAAEADPAALALYEKIRQQKKPAIALVEQGICRTCRIALPAGELQQVRGGQPVLCGSCGRILYLP